MDEPGRHDEREVFDDSWESGDSSTCGARDELTRIAAGVRRARADERARLAPRGSLTVSVEDDGAGIARAPRSSTDSLGLMGMREQASLLGGTFDIRRRRPIGTTVTLRVPLVEPRARSEQ
jgi:two-component sensor histidine kinase